MKKINKKTKQSTIINLIKLLIIIFVLAFSMNLKAQDYTNLKDIKLKDAESCAKAEKQVLECCDYLLNHSCEESLNGLSAIQFIFAWMEATPKYTFTVDTKDFEFGKKDINITSVYFAAIVKTAIENNYTTTTTDLKLKATTTFLNYCEKPENKVELNKALKKYIKAKNSNTLKQLIEE